MQLQVSLLLIRSKRLPDACSAAVVVEDGPVRLDLRTNLEHNGKRSVIEVFRILKQRILSSTTIELNESELKSFLYGSCFDSCLPSYADKECFSLCEMRPIYRQVFAYILFQTILPTLYEVKSA